MTTRMLEQAAETGRKLARLLERGDVVVIQHENALVTVMVARLDGRARARFYEGGTLDAAVAEIEVAS